MSDKPRTHAADGKAVRAARLAAELRANLLRRKAQARGRADERAEGAAAKADNDNKRQDS